MSTSFSRSAVDTEQQHCKPGENAPPPETSAVTILQCLKGFWSSQSIYMVAHKTVVVIVIYMRKTVTINDRPRVNV